MNNESLKYYQKLRYKVDFYPCSSGYVAIIPELPGCLTQGETLEETARFIEDAKQLWIETAYQYDLEIPLPKQY